MRHSNYSRDGPPTLAERVEELNESLADLAAQVKVAFAKAVGNAVADAVRDTVARLLGHKAREPIADRPGYAHEGRSTFWGDARQGGWHDDGWDAQEDDGWGREEEWDRPIDRPDQPQPSSKSNRWHAAVVAALQASLWWLRRQPAKRPLLATSLVALTAGTAALLAGPGVTTTVAALGSAIGLMSLGKVFRSAAAWLADRLDPTPDAP